MHMGGGAECTTRHLDILIERIWNGVDADVPREKRVALTREPTLHYCCSSLW